MRIEAGGGGGAAVFFSIMNSNEINVEISHNEMSDIGFSRCLPLYY